MSKRGGNHWRGPLYLDASALVKLYLPEPGSDPVDDALHGRHDVILSDLAITEVTSALARRVREGSLDPGVARRTWHVLQEDTAEGLFLKAELLPRDHREAERMLLKPESVPLRAADALHLALAVSSGAASVVTFDVRMATAARGIGLDSVPDLR